MAPQDGLGPVDLGQLRNENRRKTARHFGAFPVYHEAPHLLDAP
jgi:hypothetical protein